MDIKELKEKVSEIKDPRRQYGNLRHKLEDIVIIGLLSTISMGEDFEDMEIFGRNREKWLKTFLELPNGIPDSDTFRRLFERLEPNELSKCLNTCLESLKENQEKGIVINIDGKTINGSGNNEHNPYNVVSVWDSENQITLAEMKTEDKSNEIKIVPALLDLVSIEGSIVTADAMNCQKNIVKKIIEKKADYVIALKGNQGTLYDDVELYFNDSCISKKGVETFDLDHGRIERREYYFESNIDWLIEKSEWSNLKGVGMVKTKVEEKGKGVVRNSTRYYISSLCDISSFAYSVRKHWSIENQLHWCLDVVFREDSSKVRKDNSPLNMNVLRKAALSLLKKVNIGKISLRKKMYSAALDFEILNKIVFGEK